MEIFMRLNIIALSISASLIWGGAIFIVAVANLVWPSYGIAFLNVVASIYPGYNSGSGIGSVITGTFLGLVDGAIGGAIFGWLYNILSQRFPGSAK